MINKGEERKGVILVVVALNLICDDKLNKCLRLLNINIKLLHSIAWQKSPVNNQYI